MRNSITIRDIAKACNCSVTAVSFVLNDKCDNIGKDTIEKIKSKVKELGYCPSISAASLKTKKTQVVGLLIPDIENDFYVKLIKNLETLLYARKYSLMIMSTNDNFEKEMAAIDMFKRRSIDYLILVPGSESLKEEHAAAYADCLKELTFKYLIFDRTIDLKHTCAVLNDDVLGGQLATEYLINTGHKRIACITGPRDISSSRNRLQGYKDCLTKHHIAFDSSLIYEGNYRYDSGVSIAQELFQRDDIDAVFAFNDLMAYGVYSMVAQYKKEVGQDIHIIGYDDNTFSSLITPPLTTIRPNVDEIAQTIFEIIFAPSSPNEEIKIKPSLIVRDSVGVNK